MHTEAHALLAVAAGGALGALARWGVGLGIVSPMGTVAVNVSGCLLIGLLAARVVHPTARAFVGTGVLGGYTTFSTASTDAVALLRTGAPALAVGYAVATLAICTAATLLGLHLGRRREGRAR